MSKPKTICKHCGGEAEWWDEKEVYYETTGRGRLRTSWNSRWHQCLETNCGKKYSMGTKNHRESDATYYSNTERRVYNL